jgi:hypothetical protein
MRAIQKQHLWLLGTGLRAWLFTILHDQHVNDVRRGLREGSVAPVEDAESASRVEPAAHVSLALKDLDRAIAMLPMEQRAVLLLVGLEGIRYDQAASVLNVPVGTVRSRLSRARSTLRLLMDGGNLDRRSARQDLVASSALRAVIRRDRVGVARVAGGAKPQAGARDGSRADDGRNLCHSITQAGYHIGVTANRRLRRGEVVGG